MIKVTVECEDLFTGEKKNTDLYFHLTEAELASLNIMENNRYTKYSDIKDKKELDSESLVLFEKLIEKAYGQRTENGMFIKDDMARKAFLCSPEYSALLIKMSNGEISAKDFIMGCFPKNISSKILIKEDGTVGLKE